MLVSARTDWACLDSLIAKTFKVRLVLLQLVACQKCKVGFDTLFLVPFFFCQDYLTQVDPTASLGLSCDSLHMYQLTQGGQRVIGGDKPQVSPYRCLGSGSAQIFVTLKGKCPLFSLNIYCQQFCLISYHLSIHLSLLITEH